MKSEINQIDLRKINSLEQVTKINEILNNEIDEIIILTDLEVIIKMIPIQIINKDLVCQMKAIKDYWKIRLERKKNE